MSELILRPYQREDVDFMKKYKKTYNCNDMGLGKTVETLVTRVELGVKKTLIVSPKIALGVWQNELIKFFSEPSLIYTGTPSQRKKIWTEFINTNVDVLITNPAQLLEIKNNCNTWEMIIVDEVHLAGLLNHKTKTYKVMEKLKTDNMILLTGTPIRRNLADLYGPLHLLNPEKFKSYWQFVSKYCITMNNGYGVEILSKPRNPLELKRMLDFHMIRRLKSEVLSDLPEKIRSVLPLQMNKLQGKSYYELESEMMIETDDDFILTQNAMVQTLRLRQLLVCPKLLGINDYGAGIELLGNDLIPIDFNDNRSVCICTPFRKAIPFIIDYLQDKIEDISIFEIHGGIKETAATVAMKFQECKTHRKVLIYSIKSGASFTATDASITYFLGAEWSNTDNAQAEDRIFRIGQTRGVDIKYICYNNTVDDNVKDRLNEKSLASHWVLNPVKIMEQIQKRRKDSLTKIKR